jgi:kanamycin kinase
MSIDEALRRATDGPPIDRLVVCHGDACAPNTLLADDGRWTGHGDVGALGLADRWADLAIATWSVAWNYGTEWEGQMLEAYGITRDDDRIAYYRLLWDLGYGELSGSSVRQQGEICCA